MGAELPMTAWQLLLLRGSSPDQIPPQSWISFPLGSLLSLCFQKDGGAPGRVSVAVTLYSSVGGLDRGTVPGPVKSAEAR